VAQRNRGRVSDPAQAALSGSHRKAPGSAGGYLPDRFAFFGPWSLILIGAINSWKLVRESTQPSMNKRPVIAQPFLLGMLLAAGFETASQLSAMILAGQTNPWLLGAAFSLGMMLVDGLDGYLAASTQTLAASGQLRAKAASRALGALVVAFAFGLGFAELAGVELNRIALPTGLGLFATVLGIRLWARSDFATTAKSSSVPEQAQG